MPNRNRRTGRDESRGLPKRKPMVRKPRRELRRQQQFRCPRCNAIHDLINICKRCGACKECCLSKATCQG